MPATIRLPSRRKYRNTPTVVDGIRFDSKKEAKRWEDLKILQASGVIFALERQPEMTLHALGGNAVGTYRGDFRYIENGLVVVEDVKGKATDLYKWKRRHVLAEYGIRIKET